MSKSMRKCQVRVKGKIVVKSVPTRSELPTWKKQGWVRVSTGRKVNEER